jgi:lactobin A/cerein 7B family class IIb bacteriocin
MNQNFEADAVPGKLDLHLLSEQELLAIRGGLGPLALGAALIGGGLVFAALGAAAGMLMYAAFRNRP